MLEESSSIRQALPGEFLNTVEKISWSRREPARRGRATRSPCCLIQAGVDDYNAVIDVRAPIDLEPLARIFESPSIVKVIHNATLERSVLQRMNIGLANIFGTLAASRRIRVLLVDGAFSDCDLQLE